MDAIQYDGLCALRLAIHTRSASWLSLSLSRSRSFFPCPLVLVLLVFLSSCPLVCLSSALCWAVYFSEALLLAVALLRCTSLLASSLLLLACLLSCFSQAVFVSQRLTSSEMRSGRVSARGRRNKCKSPSLLGHDGQRDAEDLFPRIPLRAPLLIQHRVRQMQEQLAGHAHTTPQQQ